MAPIADRGVDVRPGRDWLQSRNDVSNENRGVEHTLDARVSERARVVVSGTGRAGFSRRSPVVVPDFEVVDLAEHVDLAMLIPAASRRRGSDQHAAPGVRFAVLAVVDPVETSAGAGCALERLLDAHCQTGIG